jgi:hypothetical protein
MRLARPLRTSSIVVERNEESNKVGKARVRENQVVNW